MFKFEAVTHCRLCLELCTLNLVLCSLIQPQSGSFKSSQAKAKYKDQSSKNVFLITKKAAFRAASYCRFRCRSLYDDDSFVLVKVSHHDFDYLAFLCRHQLADVIRLNRQLAMFVAAIDQHGKLHAARPSEIDQLVDRCAHRATSVKHVVDQNDVAPFDIAGQFSAADDRFRAHGRQIVAIQSYVENADRRPFAFEIGYFVGDALSERDAAAANAHEHE